MAARPVSSKGIDWTVVLIILAGLAIAMTSVGKMVDRGAETIENAPLKAGAVAAAGAGGYAWAKNGFKLPSGPAGGGFGPGGAAGGAAAGAGGAAVAAGAAIANRDPSGPTDWDRDEPAPKPDEGAKPKPEPKKPEPQPAPAPAPVIPQGWCNEGGQIVPCIEDGPAQPSSPPTTGPSRPVPNPPPIGTPKPMPLRPPSGPSTPIPAPGPAPNRGPSGPSFLPGLAS